jgi:hypothetical protein
MPAKDLFHDCVRHALIHDGWTFTHDPLRLTWGGKDLRRLSLDGFPDA